MSHRARRNVRASQPPEDGAPSPHLHSRRRMLAMMAGLAGSCGFVLYRAHAQAAGTAAPPKPGSLVVPPRRGAIYDRHGTLLAMSVTLYRVKIDPARLSKAAKNDEARTKLEASLAGALGVRASRLHSQLGVRTLVVPVSPVQARRVAELALKRAGVTVTSRRTRVYPAGRVGAHVVGWVAAQGEGADGIERAYNTQLRGATDQTAALRDGRGKPIVTGGVPIDQSAHGQSVWLTLDAALQEVAERALRSRIDEVQARAGHVVVVDPVRGEILALASHPTFHPSLPGDVGAEQRRNRAVADAFEPGSVVKAFALAGALDAGAVGPDDRIDCQKGQMRIGSAVLHDAHPHAILSVSEVLVRSSNIGIAKISAALGAAGLHRTLRSFGFGERSGVDLPGETTGSLRPHQAWQAFDAATISFGQGMSASSLQLAAAMSALANGGMLMRPFVVARVVDADGKTRETFVPTARRRAVREETARRVTTMLTKVTEEGGTGTAAAITGVEVAGKTGTAQQASGPRGYASGTWTSSFVGFAPAGQPRAVVSVVIDAPRGEHTGGAVAGPVFREVMHAILRRMP